MYLQPEGNIITRLALMPPEARRRALDDLTEQDAAEIVYDWRLVARPDQLPPPGDWSIWLNMSGRGAGKTRAGAEWIRERALARPRRIALVAPTAGDARDVMVEGESGLLSIHPPW